MKYCKVSNQGYCEDMPNPITITIMNPTEEQKKLIAQLDNWYPRIDTDKPQYDENNERPRASWKLEEVDGVMSAVQHWEIEERIKKPIWYRYSPERNCYEEIK